jgi:cytochrome c1
MNVTEYYDLSFLRKWISDPQTIRYRTAMAPFRPDEPKRNDMITDIIEYLKAMKENKIKPKK